jgi:uncharacterized protein YjbI with pentapeptide repeats
VKQAPSAKKFVFSRRKPDIPSDLAAVDAAVLSAGRDISVSERSLQELRLEVQNGGTLHLEASILERVVLANCTFGSIVFKDVRLIGCDLANLQTRALSLTRVEFVNCRMTGLRAGDADCRDVLIEEGDQRYAQFRYAKFRSAEFDTCNFEEADFQGADLTGSIFRKCNLRNAEMSKVKLLNADLRGSSVESLHLNAEDVRGAVVDLSQAMIFAPLLGIRIE